MTSCWQKVFIGLGIAFVPVLFVFGLLMAAAIYGHNAAIRAGNEAATIQNLKTIAADEVQYFNSHNRTYGTLSDLEKERILSSKFAGKRSVDGYVLKLTLDIDLMTNATTSFSLSADPVDDSSGKNHFYLDSTSRQIHVNADRPAGPNDPLS